MNFDGTKKILVIKLRHVGDVLLTVPVFRALRENFREAHISALVNSGTEEVLKGNPLIDEILLFERSIKGLSPLKRYLSEAGFLRRLRDKGFDMTVDLTGGDRPAVISFASGARYRLGWRPKKGFIGKKRLYTHLSSPEGRRHMVLQNLDVVSQYGIHTENLSVDFHIPEEARMFVKKILEENNPPPPLSIPPLVRGDTEGLKGGEAGLRDTVVHIHPTSRWLFKCWKDEYMAEVIGRLLDQGVKVVVTSSPDPKEINKAKRILSFIPSRITHHASRLIDLCGKTTIKQLGAVSEAADLFFGVDSAPMHIAAAVGTPVVALFGPSGAYSWGPWDNESSRLTAHGSQIENPYAQRNGIQRFGIHTVIQRDWDCIPCGSDGCGGSKMSRCLEDITVDEVKNILTEKLKEAR
ncbi:MAG: glycosyltransferase family 9 protein [Nitrospirae bacterium]|nr:glycosyltransferase family 9 protein [Nitrospirota bacterium]